MNQEAAVRLAAFNWLREQVAVHGEVLTWSLLIRGFVFAGVRVPLVSQQGIFKPKLLDLQPDYRVIVRRDLLDEEDGPMLLHGLQELHGRLIELPRRADWLPSRDALSQRLRRFGAAE